MKPDVELLAPFSFLTGEYGFAGATVTEGGIRFESATTIVELRMTGHREPEVGLWIARKEDNRRFPTFFNLGEILRECDSWDGDTVEPVVVTSMAMLADQVRKWAPLLRVHGREFLSGSEARFLALRQSRRHGGGANTVNFQLRVARVRAEKAWRARDYPAVARLLKPFAEHLDAREKRRIEFALRRR